MKIYRKFATALFLGAATMSHAGEYENARDQAYSDAMVISVIKNLSTCAIIGIQVEQIMLKRLNGTPMSTQMAEPNLTFFSFVIRDAYKQPFYETPKVQAQLVREFRERYEVECYDVLGSAG